MIRFEHLLKNKNNVLYLNEIAIYIRIAYRQAEISTRVLVEQYIEEVMSNDGLNIYIEDIIVNNIILYKKYKS